MFETAICSVPFGMLPDSLLNSSFAPYRMCVCAYLSIALYPSLFYIWALVPIWFVRWFNHRYIRCLFWNLIMHIHTFTCENAHRHQIKQWHKSNDETWIYQRKSNTVFECKMPLKCPWCKHNSWAWCPSLQDTFLVVDETDWFAHKYAIIRIAWINVCPKKSLNQNIITNFASNPLELFHFFLLVKVSKYNYRVYFFSDAINELFSSSVERISTE